EVTAAPVRMKTNTCEGKADRGRLARDPQVARERQTRARAGCRSVDRRDDRLAHAVDRPHDPRPDPDQPLETFGVTIFGKLGHDVDITAGREGPAHSRDDDARDLVISLQFKEPRLELLAHRARK